MKNALTRTIVTANAYALSIGEIDTETMQAKVEKIGGVEFISTKPNTQEAYQALKQAGFHVKKKDVRFDVVGEEVRAISFDDFMNNSVVVTRQANGRVVENS